MSIDTSTDNYKKVNNMNMNMNLVVSIVLLLVTISMIVLVCECIRCIKLHIQTRRSVKETEARLRSIMKSLYDD